MRPKERYKLLSVLMPVYNEARTLRRIVRAVLACPSPIPLELVIVDDASTDKTPEILRELAAEAGYLGTPCRGEAPNMTHSARSAELPPQSAEPTPRIRIITQPVNRGKGAAIRTAIQHMQGDIAIVQDADLEYDPQEIPLLLAPILEGKADAVFGSRFAAGPQRKILLYWHSVANRLLTWTTNILNDINLTDMETCYKAVRADVLKHIPLKSDRFGIEPELTTRLVQWNLRLYEVPISYHGRTAAEGKKIGWRDAISAGWCLFKYRFLDTRFTTQDGYYILQSIRRARRFNRWMFSRFNRFVGERVYEAGCGIGNFTELLLEKERLVCVDYDPFYVEMINRRFGHLENVRTDRVDLSDRENNRSLARESLDTVISLNVVEHIERDEDTLGHFYDILSPGGHAIILVPAHPWLFTECDRALGHFRRYTEAELREKLTRAGFEVASIQQFNRLGVFGWWLNGKLGRRDLSPYQMKLYERLLPIARLMDGIGKGPGLSLIAVGRKPAGAEPPLVDVQVKAAAPARREVAAANS